MIDVADENVDVVDVADETDAVASTIAPAFVDDEEDAAIAANRSPKLEHFHSCWQHCRISVDDVADSQH